MALSGSVDFSLNRDQALNLAFELIQVKDPDRDLTATQSTTGQRVLNMMLKEWGANGLHLWKTDEGVIIPALETRSFSLGPSGTNACLKSDLVQTTVDGQQTSVTTSITVASTTGMAASDTVLIEVDEALVSRTVNAVSSATVFTVTSTLGSVTLDDGAFVYAYTSKVERPNRILSARVIDSDSETPMDVGAREQYFSVPNKDADGVPTQLFYDPKLTNGTAYIWPRFESVRKYIQFTFERQIQDMDSASDDFDFPPEWSWPIVTNIAERLLLFFPGTTPEQRAYVKAEAEASFDRLMDLSQETGSVFFTP